MGKSGDQPEKPGNQNNSSGGGEESASLQSRLAELQRVNRALRLLSSVNQALMHAATEADLIRSTCEIAVDEGKYLMAWVGFAEHDAARTVRPICHAGRDEGFLREAHISWADNEYGQGPTGTAIRTEQPAMQPDLANMPTVAPWREAALARGYRSGISLPLLIDGKVIGSLTLYGDKTNAFFPDEIQLLVELAGDLSYGISALRTRQRHKRAEEALRASEEKFSKAFYTSPDAININRLSDGVYLDISESFTEITGYTREEVIGKTSLNDGIDIWVHPKDRERLRAALREQGEIRGLETEFRRKDGRILDGMMSATMIELNGEQCILSITRDITESKRAERELRKSDERYRILYDAISDGIIVHYRGPMGELGTFIDVNDVFCRRMGYTREEMLRMSPRDIDAPDTGIDVTPYRLQVNRGEDVTFEQVHVAKDGRRIPVEIHACPFDFEGKPATLSIVRDITERKRAEEERERLYAENKAQRILFETIVHEAPAGIALLEGPEHRFTLANPAYLPFVSGKGEVVGRTVVEVFPEIASIVVPLLDKVYDTGEPFYASDMPFTLVRDGKAVLSYFTFTYTPWRDARGDVQGVLSLSIETTASVQARREVDQERSLLRTVLSTLPVGVLIIDAEGRFVNVNDAMSRIWGGPVPMAKNIDEYAQFIGWWADTGKRIETEEWAAARALKKGESSIGEIISLQRYDNTVGTILNSAVPLRDDEGNITGAVLVIQDITELKQAEDTIKRERAFLASAIELLPFPIFFASTGETIFRTNQACREFLHEDGLEQWRAITLLDPNTHETIVDQDRGLTRLLQGEAAPPSREVTMLFPDGREMSALLFMAPIAIGEHSIAAVVAFQDITSLKEADQAKNQFLKVISHELRTPLTSILGWAQMVRDEPQIATEAIPIILQSAQQFEGLLERMIILSRILTGKLTARLEAVDVCKLANELRGDFHPAAEHKNVKLIWNTTGEAAMIQGDEHLLRMAFAEIIDNAIKFSPAGGSVTLACRKAPDGGAMFSVSDTGRGISAEELPNVMKPFSQFRREEALGGIGIGLTLAQGIAQAHHGELTVDSPGIDQGTTFTFRLPGRA